MSDTPAEQIMTYLMDMDGVLVRGAQIIPGADDFIARLRAAGKPFSILTNNSLYTPRDLQARLALSGLHVSADELYTSAMATAQFLHRQMPNGSAYVIGEAGLTTALHDIGYILTETRPDYVVLGETLSYSFVRLTQAIRLILEGARFIATNPDVIGPSDGGMVPAQRTPNRGGERSSASWRGRQNRPPCRVRRSPISPRLRS